MEIKRDYYLNMLIQRKGNGLVKTITGLRRAGKSYLLSVIFKNHLLSEGVKTDHIIEMSFDDRDSIRYLDPDVFYAYAKQRLIDEQMHYFLLDEIQLLPEFESVLNGLMRKANTDVYVTGSNARFLSKDIITEFRGRGDEVHIWPLSFSEFMSAYSGDVYHGLEEYMLYGGIPPVVQSPTIKDKIEMLNTLFQETYISDIIGRHKLRNTGEMEDLLDFLSSSIGSLTNTEKLKNTFKSVKNSSISPTTINRYLGYLSDSFLIESAKRYDIKGKRYIGTPLKYYFSDLGLRNARLNFRQYEQTHSMENVIYNELRRRRFNVDVGLVEVNQKGEDESARKKKKQVEVDFVCNQGSRRYYIQSAYSMTDEEKKAREEQPLKGIGDSFKKIIITKDALSPMYTDAGILILGIYDFLLKEDSLDF